MKKALHLFRSKVPWQWRWVIYAASVIASFYLIEDTCGWYALKKAKEAYLKTGRSLDIDEILGPPPPDDENFGAVDFIIELYDSEGKADVFPELQYNPPYPRADFVRPKSGIHKLAFSIDEFIPITERTQLSDREMGEVALQALSSADSAIEEIVKALERPKCRYPGELSWDRTSRHTSLMMTFSTVTQLRAIANLYSGKKDEAVTDWVAIDLIGQRCGGSGDLVSVSVGMALQGSNMQTVWEFLNFGTLDDRQLSKMESHLVGKPNPGAVMNDCFEVHLATTIEGIESLICDRKKARQFLAYSSSYEIFPNLPEFLSIEAINKALLDGLAFLSPRGWWWQNSAHLLNLQTGYFQGVSPPLSNAKTIYHSLLEDWVLPYDAVTSSTNDAVVSTQLAILAIQLERYKLKNGDYPSSVSALDVPSDNYGYQPGKNGRPIIYYNENGTLRERIPEDDFDQWKSRFLWRYP